MKISEYIAHEAVMSKKLNGLQSIPKQLAVAAAEVRSEGASLGPLGEHIRGCNVTLNVVRHDAEAVIVSDDYAAMRRMVEALLICGWE